MYVTERLDIASVAAGRERAKVVPISERKYAPLSQKYIPQFDGLRALAVLGVLLAHSPALLAIPGLGWLEYGRFGVDLFFVLSGFLITGILLDAKHTPHYFRNFYARRALRIWPLYYVVLLVAFLIAIPWHLQSAGQWLTFALYAQNLFPHLVWPEALSHTWSLAIEEQFYLVWPLVVALLGRRKLAYFALFGIVSGTLCRIASFQSGATMEFVHRFTLFRMDALLLGAGVALLVRTAGISEKRIVLWSKLALVTGIFGSLLCRRLFHDQSVVFSYPLIGLAFAGLLLLAYYSHPEEGWLREKLSVRPLRFLGKISYGIYLWQMPVFVLLARWMPGFTGAPHSLAASLMVSGLRIVVVLLVATVSWFVLELPILRLKERFALVSAAN